MNQQSTITPSPWFKDSSLSPAEGTTYAGWFAITASPVPIDGHRVEHAIAV